MIINTVTCYSEAVLSNFLLSFFIELRNDKLLSTFFILDIQARVLEELGRYQGCIHDFFGGKGPIFSS